MDIFIHAPVRKGVTGPHPRHASLNPQSPVLRGIALLLGNQIIMKELIELFPLSSEGGGCCRSVDLGTLAYRALGFGQWRLNYLTVD
jgi:hypothetical protein